MMKTNKILLMVITLLLSIMLTGCENRPNTNIDEAKKVALKYMEKKYNVSFNVESCKETKGDFTSESVRVEVRMKSPDSDTEYIVELTPSFTDDDKDGFYDAYEVIYDNYMCGIITPLIKADMDGVLQQMGICNFVSYVENLTQNGVDNGRGFLADFPIITNDKFKLKNVMHDYDLNFYYQIHIPENEYSKEIENEIITNCKPLFSADFVSFHIYVYSNDDFDIINDSVNNGIFDATKFQMLDEISFNID